MKKKIIGIFVCILLFATAVLPIASSTNIESNDNNERINKTLVEEYVDFVPGEFFVKFREDIPLSFSHDDNIMLTGVPYVDGLNQEFKVHNIEETILSVIKKPKNPELFESIGLDRIYTFKVGEKVNILDAVEAYENNPYVEFAEPNCIGHGCVLPNDPNFNLQWGLHNTGQTGGTTDADIDAPEAWDIETGDSSIVVAIVDSGIDWNHQDLSTRIWENPNETINGIDDDGNGFIDDIRGWDFVNNDSNPMDDHPSSHGTHCTGIVGASTGNNMGVAGVDWNCQLMAVKAMLPSGTIYWSDAGPALIYAADMGAHVISMSWAGTGSNQTLKDAVDYAYDSGCVLVAAMGNQASSTPRIPASYSNTVAVGATNSDDERWSSSNYGNHIDVVAPGVDIYSTLRNNQYGYMSGTSMATPLVAGVAALLLAQDPTRTNTEIREILRESAEDEVGDPSEDTPGWDRYHGYGRINAFRSLISKTAFLIGLISNFNSSGDFITCNAGMLLYVGLKPFDIKFYSSSETIIVSKDYLGYIGSLFVIGFFKSAVI